MTYKKNSNSTVGKNRPWMIAHQGASSTRPGNTVTAFDAAIHVGVDGIELDVQLSRDGIPVVFHDRTLLKFVGDRILIAHFKLSDLRKIDIGSWFGKKYRGERILTLQEVLKKYGSRTRFFIEIKAREGKKNFRRHRELARKTVELILKLNLQNKTAILAYEPMILRTVSGCTRSIPCFLNLHEPVPSRVLVKTWKRIAAGACMDIRDLTPLFVREMHANGMKVITFGCNTKNEVNYALRINADGLISDKPRWLVRYFKRKRIFT